MEFHMDFGLANGRHQIVYVKDSSRDDNMKGIITIFSPARILKQGLFGGLSKEHALDLLRLNEKMLFARFGIWESKGMVMVVASIDHLLDTLDPEEFRASTLCVAMAADDYERKFGTDDF